jgi:hypothetical protein
MTNQTPIDYSSTQWANKVASDLNKTKNALLDAGHLLRRLVDDMDADGNDMQRGPHAPPIEDILALVRIAASLTAQQQGGWISYAAARRGATNKHTSSRAGSTR